MIDHSIIHEHIGKEKGPTMDPHVFWYEQKKCLTRIESILEVFVYKGLYFDNLISFIRISKFENL